MEKISKEALLDILQTKLGKEVSMSDHLTNDLGMDSLDMAELVIQLSDMLGSEIPEEKSENFHTVQDVWDYIQEQQDDTANKGEGCPLFFDTQNIDILSGNIIYCVCQTKKGGIMRKRKKEIVEDDNEKLMNFTKEKFLSLLRDRLVVDEELVSDEELLSEDMRGSLDVDSLDYVETIMDVECAIGRRISYEDVEKFKCFQNLWDYIRECQQNPQKLQ